MTRNRLGLLLIVGALALAVGLWWMLGERAAPRSNVAALALAGHVTSLPRPGTAKSFPIAASAPVVAPVALDCTQPERAAATVNGRAITVGRLCDRLKLLTGASAPRTARLLLDRLVDSQLVAEALSARADAVTDAELDAALARLRAEQPTAPEPQTQAQLRADLRNELRDRLARRKLIEHAEALAPSPDDVRAELERMAQLRAGPSASVDAWIVRLPADAPSAAIEAAHEAASQLAQGLQRGDDPSAGPTHARVAQLPRFELSRSGAEPELERVLLESPGDATWHPPVRTRAGWVVARVSARVSRPKASARAPSVAGQQDAARHAILERRLQAEEARIVAELRAHAEVAVHVVLPP